MFYPVKDGESLSLEILTKLPLMGKSRIGIFLRVQTESDIENQQRGEFTLYEFDSRIYEFYGRPG